MGLLDQPLISEMDDIERRARQGSIKACEQFIQALPTIKRVHAERLMRNEGKTPREALEQVGVLVCVREAKP